MRFYIKTGKYLTIDYENKLYSTSYTQFKLSIGLQTQKINSKQYNKLCNSLKKEGFNETK